MRSSASFRTRPAPDLAKRLLWAIGIGSLLALAVALIAQHAFGIEPCAWCVVQRIAVVAVALLALFAAVLCGAGMRPLAMLIATGVLALSVGGAVAAWYQHTVAAKQLSCAFTWADRTLMDWQLDAWIPGLFKVGATCADAAKALLLGLPFEMWSGAWFVLTAAVSLIALFHLARRRRFSSF
jgi:disulfide bond formation protein DsbB